jgi:hypothetical protein
MPAEPTAQPISAPNAIAASKIPSKTPPAPAGSNWRRVEGSIRREHTNFVTPLGRFPGRKTPDFVRYAVLRSACVCSSRRRITGFASFTISSK